MAEDNPYARPLENLYPDERAEAAAAVDAARATFRDFSERPGSEYHAASGLSPVETWERITVELARVSVIAAAKGVRDESLSVDEIALMHEALFAPVFGSSKGFRTKGEEVDYPVLLGTRSTPVPQQLHGVRWKQIRKRLNKALASFHRDVAELEAHAEEGPVPLGTAVLPPVKLYARLIRIHPFLDGNGRTAWVVFSYALPRCGLPLVATAPTLDSRWALGSAIRKGKRQDFQPLADIVEATIKQSLA